MAWLLLVFSVFLNVGWAQDDATDGHDNVLIILDASGSMLSPMPDGKDKMAAAKRALKEVVKNLDLNTHVGLMVFSKYSSIPYKLGPLDRAKMNSAIDSVRPGGGTPLGEYIKLGADALLQKRAVEHNYGTYRLLVVTDGQANDEHLMLKYAPEVVERGITMDVIGVKMEQAHTLKKLAHSYRSANDTQQLVRAVREVFAEIDTSKGTDAADDAFEVLEGFPDKAAMALIRRLSDQGYGNYPIGEKPPPPPVSPTPNQQPTSTHSPSGTSSSGCAHLPPSFGWLGILLVAMRVRDRR